RAAVDRARSTPQRRAPCRGAAGDTRARAGRRALAALGRGRRPRAAGRCAAARPRARQHAAPCRRRAPRAHDRAARGRRHARRGAVRPAARSGAARPRRSGRTRMTMRRREPPGHEKLSDTMPPPSLQVFVIEDDARYRESLELLFSHSPGFSLAGSFGAAEEALDTIAAADGGAPATVVMDLDLPGLNGIEATRRLKQRRPEALVVVLTVFDEPARILEAICAGADGYLLKRTPPQELLDQLRA